MKNSRNFYQTILTVAIVLLSVVVFGQDNGNTENPFSVKKFKTIRGDINKSNPVEGETLMYEYNGSAYQTEGVVNQDVNTPKESYSSRSISELLSKKANKLEAKEPYTENYSSNQLNNYPNPFSEKTVIEYEVDRPVYVNLSVFHNGQLVEILASDFHQASSYRATFKGMGLPAGVYTAVLTVDGEVMTKSMYKVR